MMQSTLVIEGKQFGRNRSLFPDWAMPVPAEWQEEGHALTLRDLISRIVRTEVAAYQERQSERRLIRALTQAQIADGIQRGKVEMGGREEGAADADPEAAVATALLAFEDGLYYVFVDDVHHTELDAPVRLKTESRVTFLRLVALAGG